MKRFIAIAVAVIMLLGWTTTKAHAASYHTITLDGTNDFDNATENLGTEAGRTGYLTWDANNLYIGIGGNPLVGTNSNLYVVVDTTAIANGDPRTGGGLSYQPTNESGGATYPFGADVVFLFYGSGSEDNSVQNPAPGQKYTVSGSSWIGTNISSGVRIIRKSSSITEIEIPFTQLGIAEGSDFNILFYVANNTAEGDNFAQWPTGNANGNNPILKDFYTYTRQSGIAPNSGQHYAYREDSTTGYSIGGNVFGSIFFVPASATTYNAGSLTTLGYHLYIGPNATFSMGANTAALNVARHVTVDGTLTLSSNSGGDLRVGGNFTNNGTFNSNGRQVVFNGSGTQTLTGATTFDYLDIANTAGGNVTLASNITVLRELKISSGGTLNAGATTITLRGSTTTGVDFRNNGVFNADTGTVAFEGNNNKHGRVLGNNNTTFNHVTLTSLDGTDRRFGVDFYDQDAPATRATINGTLTLTHFTFVAEEEVGKNNGSGTDGAPIYGPNSTLLYNNTGSFNSAAEWKISNTCGDPGVPYNVTISNNTTVNINAEYRRAGDNALVYAANSDKTACGTLTINSGSTLQSTAGTLFVKGNWSGTGDFTHNNGTVVFNGSSAQQIVNSRTGPSKRFYHVVVDSNVTANYSVDVVGNFTVNSNKSFSAATNSTIALVLTTPSKTLNCHGLCTFYNLAVTNTNASGSTQIITVTNNFEQSNTTSTFTAPSQMVVKGNWTNNGTFNHNNGTVTFNGISAQTIGGSATTNFYNLTLDNSAGASLGSPQSVANQLTLTNGRLTLGSYNLTLGSNALPVAGTFSADRMIVADGAGALCKHYSGTGTFLFPIGDVSGPSNTAEYSPAALNFTNGTFNSGQACVRVTDAKHPQNNSPTHYLTRYWTVTSSGITDFSAETTFTYVDADIEGTEADIKALKWANNTWSTGNAVNTAANQVAMTVNAFSDFTGGNNPTAVTLAAFEAVWQGEAVLVTWETAMELDNLGFNLYRGDSAAGPWTRLNAELIPAQNPGAVFGARYEWLDADVAPGAAVYYRLEDVDIYGVSTFHGPIQVAPTEPTAVTLIAFGARSPLIGLALVFPLGWAVWRRRR